MFCPKCGTQSIEGSAFCQKCGAKLVTDEAAQQTAVPTPAKAVQPQYGVQADKPAKKKSKKLPIILGAAALVVVLIIIVSSLGGGGINYVATAKAWAPFAQSQGLSGTCGQVIGKYIDDPQWSSTLVNGIARVAVSGTLKGATDKLSITITVAPGNTKDSAVFDFVQASVNGNQTTNSDDVAELMVAFFSAYNDGQTYFDPDLYLSSDGAVSDVAMAPSNPMSSGGMMENGETQSFDNVSFGNMEVTLDYVEFVDSIQNPMTGANLFPGEGSVFLRATLTLKNIGTESGSLPTAWATVIYDGEYEFGIYTMDGSASTSINPLTPPTAGSITFEVPNMVAESDESLVLHFGDGSGAAVMSFTIRPGTGDSVSQGASSGDGPVTDYDQAYNIAQAWLDAHPAMEMKAGGSDDMVEANGEQYYRVYMDDPGQYWFSILVHNETGEMLAMLTEDGQDPGPPDFKPIDDYYNRYWGTADSGAASGELVYQGIPVYQFFDSSIDDIIDNIGEPLSYEEYNGGRYHYDGITFVCNDSTGEIFSIELEPSACDVDGVALNKPGSRLLGILGTPTDQDFIRDVQGGTNDVVGWYMNYEREHYSFSFIMSDSGSIPSRIDIQPVAE